MTLATGTRLGQYQIINLLGAGGMGVVYQAHDLTHNRPVALKILAPELSAQREALARFDREAKALAALSHPNIVTFYDLGEYENSPYVVMEYLAGESLRTHLRRTPRMDWRKALSIGLDLVNGLAAAHAEGIVHRDLKPENIFLTENGGVKILDFGLAQIRATNSPVPISETEALYAPTLQAVTKAGTMLGTPGYMAPEQINGTPATAAADLFAFGCLIYEMLAGKPLFLRDTPANSLAATLRDNPAPLTGTTAPLPDQINQLLAECLAKEPEKRQLSMQAVAHELQTILRLSPVQLRLATFRQKLKARLPVLGYGSALLAMLALGVFGYQQWRNKATQPPTRQLRAIPGEAQDNYFLGFKYLEDRNNDQALIRNSIPKFQNALDLAPDYALAKVGLARAYILLDTPEFKLAEQQAREALLLDPNLAGAHTALAVVQMLQNWQFQAADQSFQRALKTSSGDAYTFHWLAEFFAITRQNTKAIDTIKQAERLDPESEPVRRDVARHYFYAHQYVDALRQYQFVLTKNPQDAEARRMTARIHALQGQTPRAIAGLLALQKNQAFAKDATIYADLSFCYALAGQRGKAKRELNRFLQLAGNQMPDNFYAIGTMALLDEREQAFACLENAYQKHSVMITYIQTHPALDRLREDLRFHQLLKKIGLTQSQP